MNNDNVDHKAVSHAVRCVLQSTELLETGHITLPLKDAPLLREIKAGLIPYSEVQEILTEGMENLEQIKSVLPEKPDRLFWEDRIIKYYEV